MLQHKGFYVNSQASTDTNKSAADSVKLYIDIRSRISSINPLPNDRMLDLSKFKAFADDKIILTQKFKIVLGRVDVLPRCIQTLSLPEM